MSESDELPRALAIAWGMETSPSRGPKRELSHESIVETAVQIATGEGLSAVTMQRVAKSFGFSTMALYRYVSSKDDLHILMLDHANARATEALIDDTDWRCGLRDWAIALRETFLAYPWLFELYAAPAAATWRMALPNFMRLSDNAMRAMRTLAIGEPEKLETITALATLTADAAALEVARDSSAPTLPRAAIQAVTEVATPERFPYLQTVLRDGSYFTGPEAGRSRFDAALEEFFGRLAAQAERDPATVAPEPEVGPDGTLAAAERLWRDTVALRKRASRQLSELSKVEGRRQSAYEAAKALAKAAEKASRARDN